MAMHPHRDLRGFDPNDIALHDGSIYGLPFTAADAAVVLMPVPWEVTVSSGVGTARGPAAILEASTQVDLYDEDTGDAWQQGIYMLPIPEDTLAANTRLREKAAAIIDALAAGEDRQRFASEYAEIEEACEKLFSRTQSAAMPFLRQGKIVGLVGGDHSVSLGLLRAYAAAHDDFGILHVDAHADLRERYEGFVYSHASIMHHALALAPVSRIVQVGVRDFCAAEAVLMRDHDRITAFTGGRIARARFMGAGWDALCDDIVSRLPAKVYVSFDIDGLDPSLCPNTGTPVPGGLSFDEAVHLLAKAHERGKKIIGFDLVETAGSPWDGAVGARLLYALCCRAVLSMQ